jgi:hypothetical protein
MGRGGVGLDDQIRSQVLRLVQRLMERWSRPGSQSRSAQPYGLLLVVGGSSTLEVRPGCLAGSSPKQGELRFIRLGLGQFGRQRAQ